MNTIMFIFILTCLIYIYKEKNPLKTAIILLIFSAILFLNLSKSTSMNWMPLIFFLLFMGGVLVLFMLISSILPNEKMKKMNNFKKTLMIVFSFLVFTQSQPFIWGSTLSLKTILESSNNLMWAIIMISAYFLILIFNLCKSETPLRSYMCFEMTNFVN